MSVEWKAGDPVVCIDAEWRDPNIGGMLCPLVKGQIYHVKSLASAEGVYRGHMDHIVLYLAEVENPYGSGFAAPRFRPVQKRTTSIEIFRALLNPTKVDA